jgi:nucleoside-diphosphate-sugar epimerase
MAYRRYHGVDTRIVRIFNTYGPRMRPNDGRVVSNFIVQSLQNKPLTVYGDGMQTRSFCYVSDLISGIVALLSAPPSENLNMPINIGNPEERTVRDLASKVLAMTGSKSTIEFRDLPVDDPHVRCPDISRAKTILGWKPEVGVDEGLRLTVDYFRKLVSHDFGHWRRRIYWQSHSKGLESSGLDPVIFDNFPLGIDRL